MIERLKRIILTMKRVTAESFKEFEAFDMEDAVELLNLYNQMVPKNPMQMDLKEHEGDTILRAYNNSIRVRLRKDEWGEVESELRKMLKSQAEESKKSNTNGDGDLVFDVYTLERLRCQGNSTAGFHYYDIADNKYTLHFFELSIMHTVFGNCMTDNIKHKSKQLQSN